MPARLLSRKVTGEVSEGAAAVRTTQKKESGFFASLKNDTKKLLTGAKPRIFSFLNTGCRGHPCRGSAKPAEGFAFNSVAFKCAAPPRLARRDRSDRGTALMRRRLRTCRAR